MVLSEVITRAILLKVLFTKLTHRHKSTICYVIAKFVADADVRATWGHDPQGGVSTMQQAYLSGPDEWE